ncbi:MAG: LTA synthase family protein [Lachnospiraceae bacterium]|jgi:phosphoglycerol transferase MdoB-like AlkP superfamily enzyme|nr:LTA synthase family protein [Lachnospiraceae bacterium]
MNSKSNKYFNIISLFAAGVLVFAGYFSLVLCWYIHRQYNGVSFDEIMFQIFAPKDGTAGEVFREFFATCTAALAAGLIAIAAAAVFFFRFIKNKRKRAGLLTTAGSFVIMCGCVIFAFTEVGAVSWYRNSKVDSEYVENNYTDPADVTIKAPEKKRNLIYIFMESMESTFQSKEDGGAMDEELIPELHELALNNVNFSETENVGGGHASSGATWTIAGMAAQTSGLPLLLSTNRTKYGYLDRFMPGATTLGDILHENGYYQEIVMGSNAAFEGRDKYFGQHGDYQILDYTKDIELHKIPTDYHVWWGIEDSLMYSFAKTEILNAAENAEKTGEPFNVTLLTADTHQTDGYKCSLCRNKFDDQYKNVLACASRQVSDLVSWIQDQEFFKDTTIVIAGDHTTMDNKFILNYYDGSAPRRVYNCFIDPAPDNVSYRDNLKNRRFTTLDMFPTTLSALGFTIEGNRLGLGTDLFSGEETLSEKYGYRRQDEEFGRHSKFYNEKLWASQDQ